MALIVYGIMRAGDAERAVGENAQAGAVRLEAVTHHGVSALVTEAPDGEVRLRRANIVGHADVLQAAFEFGPVLPFRFGTALAGADTVIAELLAPGAERLAARLDALDGKAEMQLKAVYAEEPLLRSILAQDAALARMVQRAQRLPAEAAHFERIRIGEAIASAVQSRAAADAQALLSALAPLALANVVSEPHHERAVLNAAFLIEQANLRRFDQEVEGLSEGHGPDIEFKLIGPMPAYSFADREWELAISKEVPAGWV